MKQRTWKIAGINFDHFHMGDLLRYAHEHPQAEVVGVSDEQPARMEEVVRKLEEGADPESLEEQLGPGDEAGEPPGGEMGDGPALEPTAKESRHRFRARRPTPRRDPKLYDYE